MNNIRSDAHEIETAWENSKFSFIQCKYEYWETPMLQEGIIFKTTITKIDRILILMSDTLQMTITLWKSTMALIYKWRCSLEDSNSQRTQVGNRGWDSAPYQGTSKVMVLITTFHYPSVLEHHPQGPWQGQMCCLYRKPVGW